MSSSRALIASVAGLLITLLCAGQTFAGGCVDVKKSYVGLQRDQTPGSSPFYYFQNFDPAVPTFAFTQMGDSGDIFVSGQWVATGSETWNSPGEGPDTVAIVRQASDNTFFLSDRNPPAPTVAEPNPGWTPAQYTEVKFGLPTDVPIAGNWQGSSDGIDKIGVWRASEQIWYRAAENSTGSAVLTLIRFGAATDTPHTGNFDEVAGDDIAVSRYEGDLHVFYLRQNDGTTIRQILGSASNADQGVVGDWDGDGRDTIGIWRSSEQTFYLSNQTTAGQVGVDMMVTAGDSTDSPMVGGWWGSCPEPASPPPS